MKTPDEIKKGLEFCIESTCEPCCPYGNAANCNFAIYLLGDALAYIRQLETDKQQLEGMLHHMNQLRDAAAGRALKMEGRVHQLEAENEKLTDDLMAECQITKEQLDRIQQLEAERDAAVADLKEVVNGKGSCFACKWHKDGQCNDPEYKTVCGFHEDKWEWRGVQKEE